ncbi:MAG: HlyD family efflux transporter periplasmic adaptor subunit [Pirellulales bacterium]|nr:HlyD family efflux transporter periplasmic adaptor subunit [Pirellulales bacterium]
MFNNIHLSVVRRGALQTTVLLLLLFVGLLMAGGFAWRWNAQRSDDGSGGAILHSVGRDVFVLAVTERGEVQSAGVTAIRSSVKNKGTSGLAIMRIAPEGTEVGEGDFLVELDSSALEEERTSQRINRNTVESRVIEAKNVYETALITEREYLEGTYVQERQTIESEVFVAEENLNRAKEYYAYSKKLAVKGYVNELQLEADKFAVDKSVKELEAAKTKLRVLDEFTKLKTTKELESNILIAQAKWEADKNSFELEEEKLREIEEQIALCTILAPRAGIVKYAHQRDRRGNNDFIVEEGAVVRERQEIIHLPDLGSMQVEILINESQIQFVTEGMPAKVAPIGMGELELMGVVESLSEYAEPSGWRKANVKEYKAFIEIEHAPAGMRAGMTASVTIQCMRIPNAMLVPVQAVYAHGPQYFCLTHDEGKWLAKEVVCGATNDMFFVVEKGLQERDRVALNPRRYLSEVELPELPPEQQQRAVPQEKKVAEQAVAAREVDGADAIDLAGSQAAKAGWLIR